MAFLLRIRLLPGQQGSMDDVRHPLSAYRPDGDVHVFQSKGMGGDLLQWKTLGGELLQGQLARLETVPARALDGDELHGDLPDREIRKLRHLALDHHRPALALESL